MVLAVGAQEEPASRSSAAHSEGMCWAPGIGPGRNFRDIGPVAAGRTPHSRLDNRHIDESGVAGAQYSLSIVDNALTGDRCNRGVEIDIAAGAGCGCCTGTLGLAGNPVEGQAQHR